jgi:hypothetical protein
VPLATIADCPSVHLPSSIQILHGIVLCGATVLANILPLLILILCSPHPLDCEPTPGFLKSAWLVPPKINTSTGAATGGDVLSSITLRHFMAYVKGAPGIHLNNTG